MNRGKTLSRMIIPALLFASPMLAWCRHDYRTIRDLSVTYLGLGALVVLNRPYYKNRRVVRRHMTYISVCSGIAGCRLAWGPLGFKPLSFADIDPFCSALLAYHHADVPNLGDFTKVDYSRHERADILVGGTPCQSFSSAGYRKGMVDPRGDLALQFLRLAASARPRWIVWENVPGVLSARGGRDFATFLGTLAKIGYGFAYRILDAQFYGVPQRRRRVFVVGHSGDWRCATAVLFDQGCFARHPASHKAASQALEVGSTADRAHAPLVLSIQNADTKNSRQNGPGMRRHVAYTLTATDQQGIGIFPTMCSSGDSHSGFRDEHGLVMAFHPSFARNGAGQPSRVNHTLTASKGGDTAPHMFTANYVRRLTPRECERLQGFPDDYTLIPYRGKPAGDYPRYRVIGNSWAIPVTRWIGERILAVETVLKDLEAHPC